MNKTWDLLIVSGRIENKRTMRHILSDLPVNTFTATTIEQAQEVLSGHRVKLIFSEQRVLDGTFRDVLAAAPNTCQVVVMLSTKEGEEIPEPGEPGVRDVIRCPLQAADVEMALIRATREQATELQVGEYTPVGL